jgi:hypothetical protein
VNPTMFKKRRLLTLCLLSKINMMRYLSPDLGMSECEWKIGHRARMYGYDRKHQCSNEGFVQIRQDH